MLWLNKIVDELEKRHPKGEIVTESGIAPSGSYHMGYLREIITTDAVVRELRRRGREAKHIHFVDDMDGFRKVPSYLPAEYEQYLGKPLCDIPAPDGSKKSYADVAFESFADSVAALGIEIDVMRSHEKYRSGFFTEAIEKTLDDIDQVRKVLEDVSGRKLGEEWSPIQVNEGGYLKKRPFKGIDKKAKTITYLDKDNKQQTISYESGDVKLDWRLDWPARWWLLGIEAEPFGRDHATKGGSFDTGAALVKDVFGIQAPVPIPYDFVNRAGDTKKMSASKGNGILMSEVVTVLPPEVARYFILQAPPSRLLFFDPEGGVVRLIDEFAALLAKPDKTDSDKQLIASCTEGIPEITVSNVPFSLLVASYQAALKDPTKTLDTMRRTEYKETVNKQEETIKKELRFIDEWLKRWAPDDVKFELSDKVDAKQFSDKQKQYLSELADKIEKAPKDADGEWFHLAIYEFKDKLDLPPKELFSTLYQAIIAKNAGPRAGWFLSLLPREWLIKRLRFEG
jgi:lysyl-tRNA synthetase class 1